MHHLLEGEDLVIAAVLLKKLRSDKCHLEKRIYHSATVIAAARDGFATCEGYPGHSPHCCSLVC